MARLCTYCSFVVADIEASFQELLLHLILPCHYHELCVLQHLTISAITYQRNRQEKCHHRSPYNCTIQLIFYCKNSNCANQCTQIRKKDFDGTLNEFNLSYYLTKNNTGMKRRVRYFIDRTLVHITSIKSPFLTCMPLYFIICNKSNKTANINS